jgi:pimeloyl-ACP methyl ester carboxylesterase
LKPHEITADMMVFWILPIALLLGLVAFTQTAPERATRLALAMERRRSGLVLKRLTIDGFDMPYLEGGHGEVLVLVHGFGGDKDNFTRMARSLTPHFRVILPDLPGFGEAGRDPAARYRIEDQVERLHGFLQTLGVDRLRLGGNSMGGFIAVQYAATYPEMVHDLWLLDPAGTAAGYDTDMIRDYAETGRSPLLMRSEADGAAVIKATMSRPPYFPPFVRKTLARRGMADFPLHSRIMEEFRDGSPLLEDRITTLATRSLIVWGAEDKVLNPKGAETLARLLPDSRTILMPGIGHLPMIETPAEAARDYLAFTR